MTPKLWLHKGGAGCEELEGGLRSREAKPPPTSQGLRQQRRPLQGQAGDGQPWRNPRITYWPLCLSVPLPFWGGGWSGDMGGPYGAYLGRQHHVDRGGLWNQTDFQTVHDP